MLKLVSAVRFDGVVKSGRTLPCRLTCAHANGAKAELVTKFSSGCDRNVTALTMEAIAAMLACDLDLPVPEPFLVSLDDSFISTVSNDAALRTMSTSSRIAFGSRQLPPGFTTWPAHKSIPRDAVATAAEIFAFDALIANDDRRVTNPNCLFNGSSIAIFDHEMAFFMHGIIGWQPPWIRGALDSLRSPGRHVFTEQLRGRNLDFDRLAGAWLSIKDWRLEEYSEALPDAWRSADSDADRAIGHVGMVRDNIEQALDEVRRVLA